MAAILRKLSPLVKPVEEKEDYEQNDDVLNTEYSIAIEYFGPPVTYDVPHALPIDFDQITTATTAASPALDNINKLSLLIPIIQPISKPKKRKPVRLDTAGSPEIDELPGDGDRVRDIANYMNPRNSESTESEDDDDDDDDDDDEEEEEDTSPSQSSEIFAEETPRERQPNTPSVTFLDPETNDRGSVSADEEEEEEDYRLEDAGANRAVRTGPRGSCYRCSRGTRLTDKVACIVCGAKYCKGCVLRSMGSMPEGRKCVGCIGRRIDEAARGDLGRRPRLLKKLLSPAEVGLILKAEVVCTANQLPANLVFVNGEPLTQEELVVLQSSPVPPKKLKPGEYWYDKVSGFWGKEGHVYSEIISAQLNIGGHIRRNCSNGNTNILINNREITKIERRILQLAGVPCEGNLHYWVNSDGSYQDEGMNNVKGNIWDKPRVKLACALLSLPILSESPNPSSEGAEQTIPNPSDDKMISKFLLVGSDQSGTSTVFKQVKHLYNVPFSEEERESIKSMIQCKLYGYLGILLEGRAKFEEEECSSLKRKARQPYQPGPPGYTEQEKTIYSIGPRLKSFEDWLISVMASGNLEIMFPAATHEYSKYVEDLWNDPAIQATYSRRNELEMLPRAATYFLNRAVEISRTDYEPTDTDILYAEGITSSNSVASVEFSCRRFDQDSMIDAPLQSNPNPMMRGQLIRVHPRNLGDKCRWLQMFEDVNIVLFCVSLSEYDEVTSDGLNKTMATKHLFETIVTHPCFEKKNFLLLLNKYDLLEEKIERAPLTRCEWFSEFRPVISTAPNGNGNGNGNRTSTTRTRNNNNNNNNTNSPTLAHRAYQYIAIKYKRLFHSLTDKKLYVSLINGLEADTIDESLRYAAEIIKWEEERPKVFAEQQISSASIEASSSS